MTGFSPSIPQESLLESNGLKPLFSLLNKHFGFNHKLMDDRISPEKTMDKVLNMNQYKCFFCNVNVPKSFSTEHINSHKHKTYKKIADMALERMRRQINLELINNVVRVQLAETYFCESCVSVVLTNDKYTHETSDTHKTSVKHDELLYQFADIYIDNVDLEIDDEKNTNHGDNFNAHMAMNGHVHQDVDTVIEKINVRSNKTANANTKDETNNVIGKNTLHDDKKNAETKDNNGTNECKLNKETKLKAKILKKKKLDVIKKISGALNDTNDTKISAMDDIKPNDRTETIKNCTKGAKANKQATFVPKAEPATYPTTDDAKAEPAKIGAKSEPATKSAKVETSINGAKAETNTNDGKAKPDTNGAIAEPTNICAKVEPTTNGAIKKVNNIINDSKHTSQKKSKNKNKKLNKKRGVLQAIQDIKKYFNTVRQRYDAADVHKIRVSGKMLLITALNGDKVKVPVEYYHGKQGDACQVCQLVDIEDFEEHVMKEQHMDKIMCSIADKHCIRSLNSMWSHCVLCNYTHSSRDSDLHKICVNHEASLDAYVVESNNNDTANKKKSELLASYFMAARDIPTVLDFDDPEVQKALVEQLRADAAAAKKAEGGDINAETKAEENKDDHDPETGGLDKAEGLTKYNVDSNTVEVDEENIRVDQKTVNFDAEISKSAVTDLQSNEETEVADEKTVEAKNNDPTVKIVPGYPQIVKVDNRQTSNNDTVNHTTVKSDCVNARTVKSVVVNKTTVKAIAKKSKIVKILADPQKIDAASSKTVNYNVDSQKSELGHSINISKKNTKLASERFSDSAKMILQNHIQIINDQLYCKFCDELMSKQNLNEHVVSTDHKTYYDKFLQQNNINEIDTKTYYCIPCDVCVALGHLLKHSQSKKHRKMLFTQHFDMTQCKPIETKDTKVEIKMYDNNATPYVVNPEDNTELVCEECNAAIKEDFEVHVYSVEHRVNHTKYLCYHQIVEIDLETVNCLACTKIFEIRCLVVHCNSQEHKNNMEQIQCVGDTSTSIVKNIPANMKDATSQTEKEPASKVPKPMPIEQPSTSRKTQKPPIPKKLYYQFNLRCKENLKCIVCYGDVTIPCCKIDVINHVNTDKHRNAYDKLMSFNRIRRLDAKKGYYCELCQTHVEYFKELTHIHNERHMDILTPLFDVEMPRLKPALTFDFAMAQSVHQRIKKKKNALKMIEILSDLK